MRWNKQYLDILANKCNFEDEERYVEFLEALNAVANRYPRDLARYRWGNRTQNLETGSTLTGEHWRPLYASSEVF